ncbi:MAG: MFS transporter [Nannocystis sp.]|nr:MFS transporter [Nannocystis sp.]
MPTTPPAGRAPPTVWTASTYFAEGLPWSLLHQVAAEFFTALGLPAREVGYTSALHLLSTLKFLWSPLVDLIGTLRGWMIATQALMGAAIGAIALLAAPTQLSGGTAAIWALLVVIGALSATHDIACDGYYMDALDPARQARFSGARVAAFRAAMLVGSSGLVYLGGSASWPLAFGLAAAMLGGLALLHRLTLPRGVGEARPRAHDLGGRLRHVARAYLRFLLQPGAAWVLAFIVTYKLGDALMFSMSKVLLRELGVDTAARGLINGAGTIASIVGAVIAGAWISKVTLTRALVPITVVMAASEPLYLLLAQASLPIGLAEAFGAPAALAALYAPSHAGVAAVLVCEQLFGGMATAAQMVFIMRRCHPEHKAAHFAFATALYALAQSLSGTYSGVVYEAHGPIAYFGLASAACVPALLLLPFAARAELRPS